jgi:hypothetical protein
MLGCNICIAVCAATDDSKRMKQYYLTQTHTIMKKNYDNETYLSLEFSNTGVSGTKVRVDRQRYINLLASALNLCVSDISDAQSTAKALAKRLQNASNMVHTMDGKNYITSTMIVMSQLLELLELLNDVEPVNKPCYVS